jgi:hypothetical protein
LRLELFRFGSYLRNEIGRGRFRGTFQRQLSG